MRMKCRWMGFVMTAGLAAAAPAATTDVTFVSLLGELTDRSVVTHMPAPSYRGLQASSYNRAAKTPDDPGGWFANGDCGYVLRHEVHEGQQEAVLMEHEGPGVLTRIWTPFFYKSFGNRQGTDIRIYLDGEATPRFTANFIALVTGKGPVPAPFAQDTVRAGDLYLPIPFAKSCKVTQQGDAFFYIVNYRAYAPGTPVESFRPELLEQHKALLAQTGAALTNPVNFAAGTVLRLAQPIPGGQRVALELPAGPAAVRHLEFRVQGANPAQALRATVLALTFDGEQTVWCPLGDFFSNVNGLDPFRMWEREVRADGLLTCRWIMPYRAGGTLVLHNLAAEPVSAEVRLVAAPWNWTADSLHFHTAWWTDVPYAPRPVRDLNFIQIKGRGLHVGDTLVVLNPLWSWWGEGDEKIYVDDDLARRFPSHFGTGSEDYYGWAGGEVPTRKDEFSAPFAANVRVGGETRGWPAGKEPYTHGYNICTRTRSLDATPFTEAFKFDMEAFNMIGSPDAFLQYALVTHWYGAPGGAHNRQPLPAAAAAPVPQVEDVAAFAAAALARQPSADAPTVAGAIELEDVREVALSPGLAGGPQHICGALPPHRWSKGGQFWGRATKEGDAATFTLLEQYQPKRLLLYPTQSYDYGQVHIFVNGKLAVEKWDGYDPASKPGAPINLGVHTPDGNVFRLKVEVAGRNPASKGFYFGLDALQLQAP